MCQARLSDCTVPTAATEQSAGANALGSGSARQRRQAVRHGSCMCGPGPVCHRSDAVWGFCERCFQAGRALRRGGVHLAEGGGALPADDTHRPRHESPV